jgi:hypothetical protein
MKYIVELASDDMMYIQNFMKIGTGIKAIKDFALEM